MQVYHTPVLVNECLDFLAPAENSVMVDGTLGEGGHSEAFLTKFPSLKIYGVDVDSEIIKTAKSRLQKFEGRIEFFNQWSDDFFINYPDIEKPSTILLDLGISIFHYEASSRGFSFSSNEKLDMRLNPVGGKTASDLLASLNEKDLADLIFRYGEERYSRIIARKIVECRKKAPVETASDLADIIFSAVPTKYKYGRLHPATRTFQALRIAVNKELDRLPKLLELAFETLKLGGKMGVISFHSLEDRIVKLYFRGLSKMVVKNENLPISKNEKGSCFVAQLLTKKPVIATSEEVKENPPSRSAKLRVIKKTGICKTHGWF